MFSSLALTILESIVMVAAALFLHAGSRRYGLAPLLLYLAGLITILQTTSPLNVSMALGGTELSISSVTLVPAILMILLVLYEAEGTAAARMAIMGIVGLSIMVLLVQLGFRAHILLRGGAELSEPLPLISVFYSSWPRTLASIGAFGGSLLTIIIVRQAMALAPSLFPSWIAPGIALMAALFVDELLFKAITSGPTAVTAVFSGTLVGKLAGGVLIWPVGAGYLQWVAPRLEGYRGLENRRPLDVVFGTYRSQESVLKATLEEQRRAEEALRASEIRFRTTFEQIGVGLAHVDLKGQFLRVNRAFCEILGYPERDILDINWVDLTHPDDLPENRINIQRLLEGEIDSYEVDKRYLRKDGTPVSCFVLASLVRDEAGEPQYFVAAIEDLTERNLTEEHLRQAQKMEAVGQLTGGIAHDFNNLLTVIMGGIQLGLEGEGEKPLEDALQAAQRGAELTHRLLAFSRKQSLKPLPLDPGTLLKNMQGLLTRTLGETVQVQLETRNDSGRCLADPAQMENAILNLALNARDAMPNGGKIRIVADDFAVLEEGIPVPEAKVGDYLRLSVIDEGTGIPPRDLGKIFDPFFTTKPLGKGSGLGLSMVYGFARQSGGFVMVESQEGEGTSVRLHLPVAAS